MTTYRRPNKFTHIRSKHSYYWSSPFVYTKVPESDYSEKSQKTLGVFGNVLLSNILVEKSGLFVSASQKVMTKNICVPDTN